MAGSPAVYAASALSSASSNWSASNKGAGSGLAIWMSESDSSEPSDEMSSTGDDSPEAGELMNTNVIHSPSSEEVELAPGPESMGGERFKAVEPSNSGCRRS